MSFHVTNNVSFFPTQVDQMLIKNLFRYWRDTYASFSASAEPSSAVYIFPSSVTSIFPRVVGVLVASS